jgi:hypothetical protein
MKPSRAIVALVVASIGIGVALLVAGGAMLTGWSSPHWSQVERAFAGLVTLLGGVMFLVLGTAIVRQCVLGYPRTTIEPAGVQHGPVLIGWTAIRGVSVVAVYGQLYLALDVPSSVLRGCRLIDRVGGWINVKSNLPRLMLTTQQLQMSMEDALARMDALGGAALDHAQPAASNQAE